MTWTPEQARQVVEAAVRAPSVHNTQPWTFTVDGDRIDVHADRSRQLTRQDASGRELLLSCGAAVAHAWLAVRALGLACDLAWLPSADPDHVARLTVGGPLPATAEDRRLLEASARRHTVRSAFAPDPVPEELVDRLRTAAAAEGVRLVAERQPERVLVLEVLVSQADRALRADPELRAELARWVRPEEGAADGVPVTALPDHGQGRGSSVALRDFDPEAATPGYPDEPPAPEHPLLLLLVSDEDGPGAWLRSGAALARVLLTATADGLVANPQTQVLEVPGLRERLVTELGLVGSPQMLLRVGYPGQAASPTTGRRPVDEVVQPPEPSAGA